MSGTSLDGIDAGILDLSPRPRTVHFIYRPFDEVTKNRIRHLSAPEKRLALSDYGRLDAHLGLLFSEAVNTLLNAAGIAARDIRGIGSHGQTMHHAPTGPNPFSLQIGDPNVIAENTGITTVADFRRRDIAAGGHGAPLVPAFHQAVFSHTQENRVILNIGGIANVTILPRNPGSAIGGFDTGPGNTLMDQWIFKTRGISYDKQGSWAKSGKILPEIVNHLKQDPYFSSPPPKSTGKEYFSLAWLERQDPLQNRSFRSKDIQASLCALTAETVCEAIVRHAPETDRILVCGGGSHNDYLLQLIRERLPCPVATTEKFGIHPDQVEAMAFAWLAKQTLSGAPGNVIEVTGARAPVILGGIYPGKYGLYGKR